MTQREWPERLASVVAQELRRYREQRGMSAQQLADACTQAGMPIQRSVIANFENGRRASVGVAELLVFAHVLDIPPVSLICPAGYEPEMEVLPGLSTDPYTAASWISGQSYMGAERGREKRSFGDIPLSAFRELYGELAMMAEQYDIASSIKHIAAEKNLNLKAAEVHYDRVRAEYHAARAAVEEAEFDDDAPEYEPLITRLRDMQRELDEAAVRYGEAARWNSDLEKYENEAEEHRGVVRDILQEMQEAGYIEPPIDEYYLERLNTSPAKSTRSSKRRRGRK